MMTFNRTKNLGLAQQPLSKTSSNLPFIPTMQVTVIQAAGNLQGEILEWRIFKRVYKKMIKHST